MASIVTLLLVAQTTQDVELPRVSGDGRMLQASAYRATSGRVRFSPLPAIRIGGCGRLRLCGHI